MRRVVPVVVGLLLAVAVLPFLPAAPAGAATVPPVLVSPADDPGGLNPVSENPVFVWQAAPGALRYVLQVSASPTMTPLVPSGSFVTTNLRGTFTQDLPLDDLYWRVGSYDTPSGGTPVFSSDPPRQFKKSGLAAPTLTAPIDDPDGNNPLIFPDTQPNFTWNAIAGAKSYEIQVDTDFNFTPPYIVDTSTTNTTFTLSEPQPIGQVLYWHVRAKSSSGATGDYSPYRAYWFSWPQKPDLISPGVATSSIPPNTLPVVEQVEFVWTPITGAVEYDLQYSNNSQFSSPTTVRVVSTHYSPPVTLNNGSYFWRVRGVTASGGTGDFTVDPYTFERAWPGSSDPAFAAPTLLTPADGVVTLRQPDFSWTPQRLGSNYQLQVSTSSTFSGGTTTYTTNHTQFTPTGGAPNPGQKYYWRVRALDGPLPVSGIYTDVFTPVRSFIYYPEPITVTGPAPGSYEAPKISWSQPSSPKIGKYRVTIYQQNGSVALTEDTYNTSYYPTGLAPVPPPPVPPAAPAPNLNPYRVVVQTIDDAGRLGPIPTVSTNPFSLITPTTTYPSANPTVVNPSSTRVPELTWRPVTGAASYNVEYSPAGSGIFTVLTSGQTTNGYSHTGANVTPGNYEWRVRAINKDGLSLGYGSTGQFTVTVLPSTNLTAPPNCPPDAACTLNYDTPVLTWDPVPGATSYRLWMALDVNFTNQVFAPRSTMFTTYTFTESLPDNQAGQAYYWYAQPCYGTSGSNEQCGTEPQYFVNDPPSSPVKAFRKKSKAVPLLTPTSGQVVTSSQITFTWTGFLQTNQSGALVDRVTQEARQYRVQVSSTADFASLVDTSPNLDQTTYTAFSKTYPEGPLWWRVVIIDGSGNLLTLPPPATFTKATPLVQLTSPAAGATTPGTPTLAWTPKTFVKNYEVEVYKNVGSAITVGNRVYRAVTEFPSTTPTTPLPAGEYGWRVRRFDADGRAGAWSANDNATLRRFTVAGAAATLLAPIGGATVDPNRIAYTWTKVNSAVQYKIESNTSSTFVGANTETITTVMNAWAPRALYANGLYYWRVHTLDAAGNIVATSAVESFSAGVGGSRYVSISPQRILDSRGPTGGWAAPLGPNQSRSLKVAGGSLPAPITATAVVLNVTAVESSAQSFMTLYPTGSPRPTAGSNLNYLAGQIIPNLVTVKVGTSGNVDIYNAAGNVNVIADMVGYYEKDSGDRYNALTPARILDSRGPTGGWNSPIGGNQTRSLQVGGQGGVPADAKAAIVNITAVEGSQQSFLMAFPTGSPKPAQASNLNFVAGQIIPNLAIVKMGTGGKIDLYNAAGNVNVIVDVVGYFQSGVGTYFHELEPSRILDTRFANGLTGAITNNQTRDLQVSGRGGVPLGADAVVMNTTAIESTAPSYLTLFPNGVTRPTVSNLNFLPGQIIPNLVTVKMDSGGKVSIYNNSGTVNVAGDVVGYYSAY